MTIRKLKEMIANLPDDMRIFADDSSHSIFGDDASEYVCLATSPMFPGKAVLQRKSDIDVYEELRAMADLAIDEGWGDEEFYSEALERGFFPSDFGDSKLVKERMESYGLI